MVVVSVQKYDNNTRSHFTLETSQKSEKNREEIYFIQSNAMMWGGEMKIITIRWERESENRENLIKPWDRINDGEGWNDERTLHSSLL